VLLLYRNQGQDQSPIGQPTDCAIVGVDAIVRLVAGGGGTSAASLAMKFTGRRP
jgi:hypothetical protein